MVSPFRTATELRRLAKEISLARRDLDPMPNQPEGRHVPTAHVDLRLKAIHRELKHLATLLQHGVALDQLKNDRRGRRFIA